LPEKRSHYFTTKTADFPYLFHFAHANHFELNNSFTVRKKLNITNEPMFIVKEDRAEIFHPVFHLFITRRPAAIH